MTPGSAAASEAVLSVLRSRAVTLAPGTVAAGGVFISTGRVGQTLLVLVLWSPALAAGRVLAAWIRLLEPPRRLRRPGRRGS